MNDARPIIRPPGTLPEAAAAPWRMLALLIAMTAIGPLSLNILMPAVPGLARTLITDPATVQLTLSLYLLGLGASQLVLGPLSDRFGRRPVVLGGLTLTAVSSLAAMAATSIDGLIVARTVQALGASTGLVVGRAIIRDLYDRDRAASMIGWVTMAMVVAPMVAPMIGGVLDTALGWQAIFAFIALASALALIGATMGLPETRAVRVSGGIVRFIAEARLLVASAEFLGHALCAATSSAIFFAFLGGAPHVVVTLMGHSSAAYGIWFAMTSVGYMAGNFLTARWSSRFGVPRMVGWGAALSLLGVAATTAVVAVVPDGGPATIFVPQILTSFGSGILLPNSFAGAVSVRPQAAGTASGITGFLQMGIGAPAAQLVGHLLSGATTALPMVLVMLGFGLACAAAYVGLLRRGSP